MNSITRIVLGLCLILITPIANAGVLREETLRRAAIRSGFVPATDTHVKVDEKLVEIGKLLFESKLLSPDQSIACASCHVDRFGSADGLQNAIGVGGVGVGENRLESGGEIIPRNTLPFWGRGGRGFDVFFWDGKVAGQGDHLTSQFGVQAPSNDPLVVAVHLPPVEIDEMVRDPSGYQTETVSSAKILYRQAVGRLLKNEDILGKLRDAFAKSADEISFLDVAESIATFIRWNFEVQETKFHRFVFRSGQLSEEEIAGGLLFYGKGRCSACHNGPYFSDFDFHAIPIIGAGFGKNGFGVDYGRYNVTLETSDRGKFRTPPLYNVTKTAPYSHSGAVASIEEMIVKHIDPLANESYGTHNVASRMDFYRQLRAWSLEPISQSVLSKEEIDHLATFLDTLNYDAKLPVKSE